jgi:hypothetical protein
MSEQNNTAERHLRFGTLGWRQPDWSQHYYPADLPEDWRLGYYANELSAVLLEPAAWCDQDEQVLDDWRDETHPGFRFYLLADAAVDVQAQSRRAATLGARLGGLLWPASPAPAGTLAPIADLPERVRGWGDARGLRLALLDVAGLDLRGRRGLLDALAPRLEQGQSAAVILVAPGVTPADAHELQTVAELMGLA